MSNRYITDRFLPDKAIDLVDEAASAQRLQQESKPDAIQELDRKIMTIQIEVASLKKETDVASKERRKRLEDSLQVLQSEAAELTRVWNREKQELQATKDAKKELELARIDLEKAQREGNFGKAGELQYATIPSIQARLPQKESADDFRGLLHDTVTANDIGKTFQFQAALRPASATPYNLPKYLCLPNYSCRSISNNRYTSGKAFIWRD